MNYMENSNTTLVKVKFSFNLVVVGFYHDSNTTLVKVKCNQHLFIPNLRNSNTTLVKVKLKMPSLDMV